MTGRHPLSPAFSRCVTNPQASHINPSTAGVSNLLNPKGSQNPNGGVTPSSWRSCMIQPRPLLQDVVYEMFSATGTLYRKKLITNTWVIILIMFMTQMSAQMDGGYRNPVPYLKTSLHIMSCLLICVWYQTQLQFSIILTNTNVNITMFVVFMETFW